MVDGTVTGLTVPISHALQRERGAGTVNSTRPRKANRRAPGKLRVVEEQPAADGFLDERESRSFQRVVTVHTLSLPCYVSADLDGNDLRPYARIGHE